MYGTNYSSMYTPKTTTTLPSAEIGAAIGAFLAAFAIFFIVLAVVTVVVLIAQWKMFKKAGRKPWEALIPVHNFIVEMELAKIETYWYFLTLLVCIPFIGWIAPIVLYFWKNIELAKAFGKSTGFGILLSLLPFVGYPMLGFGNAEYQGNNKE